MKSLHQQILLHVQKQQVAAREELDRVLAATVTVRGRLDELAVVERYHAVAASLEPLVTPPAAEQRVAVPPAPESVKAQPASESPQRTPQPVAKTPDVAPPLPPSETAARTFQPLKPAPDHQSAAEATPGIRAPRRTTDALGLAEAVPESRPPVQPSAEVLKSQSQTDPHAKPAELVAKPAEVAAKQNATSDQSPRTPQLAQRT